MKKLSLFIFGLLYLNIVDAQNIELTTLISKCKPAIISITTYDKENNPLATGTGFLIDAKGTALSCYHLFVGASRAIVKTSKDRKYVIDNIIAENKERDIIKFSISNLLDEDFQYIKLENPYLKEGEPIFTIGNPLGLDYSVSNGIISAIRSDKSYGKIIQFTAPVSAGNSGSPLLNYKGNAIGIISFLLIEGQNLNFAVSTEELNLLNPINALKYPEDITRNLRISKEDIQREKWGSSIYKVHGREKDSEKNDAIIELNNAILAAKNNYSQSLAYKNIIIDNILVNVEYIFEYKYLTMIEITNQKYRGLRDGKYVPGWTGDVPFSTTLKEFIQLINDLSILYGTPTLLNDNNNCNDCYSDDISKLYNYSTALENRIIKNQNTILIQWKDQQEKSEVNFVFFCSVENNVPSGIWILQLKPLK